MRLTAVLSAYFVALSFLALTPLLSLGSPNTAYAADLPNLSATQCDISNSPLANSSCNIKEGGAVGSSAVGSEANTQITAVRSLPGTQAAIAVHVFDGCVYVNNASSSAILVPFRAPREWLDFRNHLPPGVTLAPCAVPTTKGKFTISPSGNCSSPSPTIQKADVPYYAPSEGSVPVVTTPPFTCTVVGTCGPFGCGPSQTWTETAKVAFKASAFPNGDFLPWTYSVTYTGTPPSPAPAPMNGVCGAGTGNCSSGDGSYNVQIAGTTATWYCSGSHGGAPSDQCSDKAGVCATSQYGCATGTYTNQSYVAPASKWECLGLNGGSPSPTCIACDPGYSLENGKCVQNITGICGAERYTCSVGLSNNASDAGGDSTWTCQGIGEGGNSPTCNFCDPGFTWNGSACVLPVTGVCGAGAYTCSTPTAAVNRTTNGYGYNWSCPGSNGGGLSPTCVECEAGSVWNGLNCAPVVSGSCGKNPLSCATGTLTNLLDSGTVSTWICKGSNNGSDSSTCSSCDADYSWDGTACVQNVNGACGLGRYACALGSPVSEAVYSGKYVWNCQGQGLGSTSSKCSLDTPMDGVCAPTAYNCASGVPSNNVPLGNGNFTWTCLASGTGTPSGTCYQCALGFAWDGRSCVQSTVYGGSWTAGVCSKSCGDGVTGEPTCTGGNESCDPLTKPLAGQACNAQACAGCAVPGGAGPRFYKFFDATTGKSNLASGTMVAPTDTGTLVMYIPTTGKSNACVVYNATCLPNNTWQTISANGSSSGDVLYPCPQ